MRGCVRILFLTAVLSAQTIQEVEITGELHHQLVLANDQVRVFNVEVAAHGETLMHWHRHDYVYVMLGDAKGVDSIKGKDPVNVSLSDGDIGFVAGRFAHILRNLSAEPFRNVTIELLQDDKPRQLPVRSDPKYAEEDRSLNILNGGTEETLFFKDGVSVSEIELQPGAAVPFHRKGNSCLIVALTDYKLGSELSGHEHKSIIMKRGESRWIPPGPIHFLVNTSPNQAKFMTIEFR